MLAGSLVDDSYCPDAAAVRRIHVRKPRCKVRSVLDPLHDFGLLDLRSEIPRPPGNSRVPPVQRISAVEQEVVKSHDMINQLCFPDLKFGIKRCGFDHHCQLLYARENPK